MLPDRGTIHPNVGVILNNPSNPIAEQYIYGGKGTPARKADGTEFPDTDAYLVARGDWILNEPGEDDPGHEGPHAQWVAAEPKQIDYVQINSEGTPGQEGYKEGFQDWQNSWYTSQMALVKIEVARLQNEDYNKQNQPGWNDLEATWLPRLDKFHDTWDGATAQENYQAALNGYYASRYKSPEDATAAGFDGTLWNSNLHTNIYSGIRNPQGYSWQEYSNMLAGGTVPYVPGTSLNPTNIAGNTNPGTTVTSSHWKQTDNSGYSGDQDPDMPKQSAYPDTVAGRIKWENDCRTAFAKKYPKLAAECGFVANGGSTSTVGGSAADMLAMGGTAGDAINDKITIKPVTGTAYQFEVVDIIDLTEENIVPEHPVERQFIVNDHIIQKPKRVKIACKLPKTEYDTKQVIPGGGTKIDYNGPHNLFGINAQRSTVALVSTLISVPRMGIIHIAYRDSSESDNFVIAEIELTEIREIGMKVKGAMQLGHTNTQTTSPTLGSTARTTTTPPGSTPATIVAGGAPATTTVISTPNGGYATKETMNRGYDPIAPVITAISNVLTNFVKNQNVMYANVPTTSPQTQQNKDRQTTALAAYAKQQTIGIGVGI